MAFFSPQVWEVIGHRKAELDRAVEYIDLAERDSRYYGWLTQAELFLLAFLQDERLFANRNEGRNLVALLDVSQQSDFEREVYALASIGRRWR